MPPRRRSIAVPLPTVDDVFVAIDFETADHGADSACSVGLVRVERLQVVRREVVLLKPPRSRILFTFVHGISWPMVAQAPRFVDAWPQLASILDGASFFAAHNASFDQRVLTTCCTNGGLRVPELPFLCTVQLARRTWRLPRANLPAVCGHLGIGLKHHDAGSDAEACARIVIAAAHVREAANRSEPADRST